jgi:hypothetical protein
MGSSSRQIAKGESVGRVWVAGVGVVCRYSWLKVCDVMYKSAETEQYQATIVGQLNCSAGCP